MGLITSEKKVTFGALRSVQNKTTGGVVKKRRKRLLKRMQTASPTRTVKRGRIEFESRGLPRSNLK